MLYGDHQKEVAAIFIYYYYERHCWGFVSLRSNFETTNIICMILIEHHRVTVGTILHSDGILPGRRRVRSPDEHGGPVLVLVLPGVRVRPGVVVTDDVDVSLSPPVLRRKRRSIVVNKNKKNDQKTSPRRSTQTRTRTKNNRRSSSSSRVFSSSSQRTTTTARQQTTMSRGRSLPHPENSATGVARIVIRSYRYA